MVMAQTYADGNESDAVVLEQYRSVVSTIEYEKNFGETLSLSQLAKTPVARKRVTLALSAAIFSTVSGSLFFPPLRWI